MNESLPIRIASILMSAVEVNDDLAAFRLLSQLAEEYRRKYQSLAIGEIPGVQYARKLFHAIGLDPTRHRPSSEALLNRALKGKEFYRINSLVDIGNWCSLEFLLPICVYDRDKIKGDFRVRTGFPAESYQAHNNRFLNLENRYVLADEEGAFGSPLTDSLRTAVTTATQQALLIIFAPEIYAEETLTAQAGIFAERVLDICGGKIDQIILKKG